MICVLVKTIEKVSYRRIPIILLHLYKVTALDQREAQTSEKVKMLMDCVGLFSTVLQKYSSIRTLKLQDF